MNDNMLELDADALLERAQQRREIEIMNSVRLPLEARIAELEARLKEAEEKTEKAVELLDKSRANAGNLLVRMEAAEADAGRLRKLVAEYMDAEKAYRLAHDRGEAGPGLTLRANKADAALRAALSHAEAGEGV